MYVDHDGDMTIFHLESVTQGAVVVTAFIPIVPLEEMDTLGYIPVSIRYTQGFLRVMDTHSVLIYEHDDIRFVLTTPYDYRDLIVLAYHWV